MCSDLQHLPWMHAQNYLAIPDEFSVTGYNDSIMAVSCEPELTSVDNKLELLSHFSKNRRKWNSRFLFPARS